MDNCFNRFQFYGNLLLQALPLCFYLAKTEIQITFTCSLTLLVLLSVNDFVEAFILLGSQPRLQLVQLSRNWSILQVLLLTTLPHFLALPFPTIFGSGVLYVKPISISVAQQIDGLTFPTAVLFGGEVAILICVDDVSHETVVRGGGKFHLFHLSTHCLHFSLHVGLGRKDQSLHFPFHLFHNFVLNQHLLQLHLCL